jgi:hypothetical protein
MLADIDRSFGSLSDLAKRFLAVSAQVAVICTSQTVYRGVVVGVGSDHIVLSKAMLVKNHGSFSCDLPLSEEWVGSSIVISFYAIQIVFQPKWALAPLEEFCAP